MIPLSVRLAPGRFLDPALLVLVILAVGLVLLRPSRALGRPSRKLRAGWAIAWLGWGALWLSSMPAVANGIAARIELRGPNLDEALAGVDPDRVALVVLAGGLRTRDTSVPPRERLDPGTTERVLGASRLYHRHHFGVVVLSGMPEAVTDGMFDLMTTLGVPPERLARESLSQNTRENARESLRLLRERGGVDRIVVATSALHLRRAVREFTRAGAEVVPAAVDVTGPIRFHYDELLPSAGALFRSQQVIHELLGLVKP
jgi:uncharacterized SAM-binding protein YcdF (DUF218 family)